MNLSQFTDGFGFAVAYQDAPVAAWDMEGWNSQHPAFRYLVEELRPSSIIEVGTWKGASALNMARWVRELGLDCKIVCVDVWLENWDAFRSNVIQGGFAGVVFPFRVPSALAAHYFSRTGVTADLIYLDGDHNQAGVAADLRNYWPLVREGGVLFGDDYTHIDGQAWPGVRIAVDEFAAEHGLTVEVDAEKYILRKERAA